MSEKINWFPGHMAKALRQVEEKLKLVDQIIEIRDARIPQSSGNPELADIIEEQEITLVLNKVDLAIAKITRLWLKHLREQHQNEYRSVITLNALKGQGKEQLLKELNLSYNSITVKREEKGLKPRPLRVMVTGIPNSGKSTLINLLADQGSAKTGSKPGVTRGQQWIKVGNNIELLDTPGLLWPDITDKEMGYRLAICGSINPEVVDKELLACHLLDYLRKLNPQAIEKRYQVEDVGEHSYDLLAKIGRRRGCLMSGGKVDRHRAAGILLQEFQQGTLGRLTLEFPPELLEKEDNR